MHLHFPISRSESRGTFFFTWRPPKMEVGETFISAILYLRHWAMKVLTVAPLDLLWATTYFCSKWWHKRWQMKYNFQAPPSEQSRVTIHLLSCLPGFLLHFDVTLCLISIPVRESHRLKFNGFTTIYCFNSTIFIDHDELFINFAEGHAGAFDDAHRLRATDLAYNWQEHFTDDTKYSQLLYYLLRDRATSVYISSSFDEWERG